MPEPFSIATTILSGLGSTAATSFKLANFFKDIKNTPTDIKTCFDLTNRVRLDVHHLISLRGKHAKYLATVPDIAARVDSIIHSTSESIDDACKLLESCRKEIYEENIIPYNRKVQWVLGDSAAFARRTSNLQQQHMATILEITHLRQVDMMRPVEKIATTTIENLELLTIKKKKVNSRIDKDNLLDKSGKSQWTLTNLVKEYRAAAKINVSTCRALDPFSSTPTNVTCQPTST